MTVCVAAICTEYVIGAADRMFTAGDVQFEPAQPKIMQITSSISIMMAGDGLLQAEIVQRVMSDVNERIQTQPENWWTVSDVADLYYKYYGQARFKKAEGALLAPLGLTVETFYQQQKLMDSEFVRQIATELINYESPAVECICCGIDPSGRHIYTVDQYGVDCHDLAGFTSIGAGMGHASSQLMFAGHTKGSSPADTILTVYAAKRRAEVAPGVGRETDLVVWGPGLAQTNAIREDFLSVLQAIYDREQESIEAAQIQSIETVNRYVEALSATEAATGQTAQQEDGGGDPSVDQTDL